MTKKAWVLAAGLIVVFFADCKPDHWGRGGKYFRDGDYDRAITEYSKAIEREPNKHYLYSDRARAYFQKKDYGNTIADYTRAIEIWPPQDPNLWIDYSARADAYAETGDYKKAVADIEKVIEFDPFGFDHAYPVADNYIKKVLEAQNYDAAIDGYSALIRFQPDELRHYEARIDAYYKKGDMAGTGKDIDYLIEQYTRRITTNEPNWETCNTLLDRAKMFAYKKNRTRTYADINRARQIHSDLFKVDPTKGPGRQALNELLGMVFGLDGQIQEVMDILER
jgi:tetratricopeptide (TPR) repeat protein